MAYKRGTAPRPPSRVVVTGAGVVSAMGAGWALNAAGFRTGKVALRPVTVFDASAQRTQQAGEVVLSGEPQLYESLSLRQTSRLDRATRLLLQAGAECLDTAGWNATLRAQETALCFGTSAAAMSLGESYYCQKSARPGLRTGLAHLAHLYQPISQVRLLADAFALRGPVTVIANACASGSNAIGHAFHLIKHGHVRRAVSGGFDALSHLVFAGFDALQALSTTRPRPFAADRDGLALGEGAAVLTLERQDDAIARGATILGEIVGYGSSIDLHHLTQPSPDGEAARRSMTLACTEAGWEAAQVDYLNAHGTGTPLNDSSEAHAIAAWAGAAAARLRVSSTKGGIGHLLGGAGAVEAVVCLMALEGGWVPPNVPVPQADPACTFDLVQSPLDAPLRRVLSNSFGFGGANATLALQRFTSP